MNCIDLEDDEDRSDGGELRKQDISDSVSMEMAQRIRTDDCNTLFLAGSHSFNDKSNALHFLEPHLAINLCKVFAPRFLSTRDGESRVAD